MEWIVFWEGAVTFMENFLQLVGAATILVGILLYLVNKRKS